MRIRLDDGKSYDLLAMFHLVYVGHKLAFEALKLNFSAFSQAVLLPSRNKPTLGGVMKWALLISLHSVSLLLLPFIGVLGLSMKSYTLFLSRDASKMEQYKQDLRRIYRDLSDIEDQETYQLRLKEEIAKIKPF